MRVSSKGAWSIICLQKMLESFSYSSLLQAFGFFRTSLPPPLRPQSLPASGYSGYFPVAGGSLPPLFRSRAEARACAGSGKAARVRRERLGKGGGERREGGKERREQRRTRNDREGAGGRRVGGERKEGGVGKEERQRSAANPRRAGSRR